MTIKQTRAIIKEMQDKNMSLKSDNALLWLANRMSSIQTEMRQRDFIDKNSPLRKNNLIRNGQMIFFGYSPLTKTELMFWDEFPVTIVLNAKPSGFLGLNLHYLPYSERARFLNNLRLFVTDPKWIENENENAEFFLTYKMAKNSTKLRDYKLCIKKYYFNRMLTRVSVIDPTDWLTVPFFPMDKFKGMSRGNVWKIIKSMPR